MVNLWQWFNCGSPEEEHPACFRVPLAAWQLCSVPSYGLCLLLIATWGVWELYFFSTLLPVWPWHQLGNAHFRAQEKGLVSHWTEVCGDVLPTEKEGIILQKGSHMQIQQLAWAACPLVFVAEGGRWCVMALFWKCQRGWLGCRYIPDGHQAVAGSSWNVCGTSSTVEPLWKHITTVWRTRNVVFIIVRLCSSYMAACSVNAFWRLKLRQCWERTANW